MRPLSFKQKNFNEFAKPPKQHNWPEVTGRAWEKGLPGPVLIANRPLMVYIQCINSSSNFWIDKLDTKTTSNSPKDLQHVLCRALERLPSALFEPLKHTACFSHSYRPGWTLHAPEHTQLHLPRGSGKTPAPR